MFANSKKEVVLPPFAKLGVGMAAGVSGWMFVHPADVVKVRMQLDGGKSKTSGLTVLKKIWDNEGIAGITSGLSAAIARQVTYTAMRLALYDQISETIASKGYEPSFTTRVVSGLSAGGLASFLACPIEVSLVRMQADGRLPKVERRGYTNVFNALIRIAKEDGILAYWRGATPTVARAMVVSATQLGCYDQAKQFYKAALKLQDGISLQLLSSVSAGFVYSLASLPLDNAKTRMQTQSKLPNGSFLYTSTVQTLVTVAQKEGISSLWSGFGAYFLRGGGHTVFMLLFKEQYDKLAKEYFSS